MYVRTTCRHDGGDGGGGDGACQSKHARFFASYKRFQVATAAAAAAATPAPSIAAQAVSEH